jgi:hypothetical protein
LQHASLDLSSAVAAEILKDGSAGVDVFEVHLDDGELLLNDWSWTTSGFISS